MILRNPAQQSTFDELYETTISFDIGGYKGNKIRANNLENHCTSNENGYFVL